MRPILTRALSLAAENRRLRDDCEQLLVALHLANDCTDKARMDLRRVTHERDRALATVTLQTTDIAGLERIVKALMEHAPSDARSLDG